MKEILLSMVLPASRHDIDYRDILESIRSVGQLKPITVRRQRNGYKVLDGQRRVSALKELGKTHVDAEVID